jgi:hypothetical protein
MELFYSQPKPSTSAAAAAAAAIEVSSGDDEFDSMIDESGLQERLSQSVISVTSNGTHNDSSIQLIDQSDRTGNFTSGKGDNSYYSGEDSSDSDWEDIGNDDPNYNPFARVGGSGATAAVPALNIGNVTNGPNFEMTKLEPDSRDFKFAKEKFDTSWQPKVKKANKRPNVVSVDSVTNRDLEYQFEQRKLKLAEEGSPVKEVWAFHVAKIDAAHLEMVLRQNFQPRYATKALFGVGVYLSTKPEEQFGVAPGGGGLVLCKLLPGNAFADVSRSNIPTGYHSKHVPKCETYVISKADQILPCYVIRLDE